MSEPAVSHLWPALLRARKAIQRVPKTATNPHFKNSYAPLEDILALVLPALRAEGLVLSSACAEGPVLVVSITASETGETVTSTVPLVGCSDMQKLGGAMTYAARYGIAGLLALELEGTDDDGNTASAPQVPARPQSASTAGPRPQAQGRAAAAPQGKHGSADYLIRLCRLIDQDTAARTEEGRKPWQYVSQKGDAVALYGRVTKTVGIEKGIYTPARLAKMGRLEDVIDFFEAEARGQGLALPGYETDGPADVPPPVDDDNLPF